MTQKLRKTLIMVVMTALIICLMAASLTYTFTYGRYAGGKFDNENSPYGDLIEFVGANQYIVRTPEELIQAIEDGYSNIKIADDAEEPFVIDTGVTDVSANLVLDLNGTNVIRNSRNPLLDVKEEVSVVLVYDSSKTAGSFYNPVGSNLQVSGGTLTVAVGSYESGPKDGEYTSDIVSTTTAYLVTRESRTSAYGEPAEVDNLPQVGGNVYYSPAPGGVNTDYIKDDTFLIYTEEQGELVIGKLNGDGDVVLPDSDGYDDLTTPEQIFIQNGDEVEALSVACNVASCDFYYYYDTGDWIDADGKRKQGERATTGFTPIYAVIYGYNDVKTLAEGQYDASTEEYKSFYNQADLVWPYAAVRMVEGEGFARGGQFSNNFGTVNSYGIYANGGALTASGANFTTGGEGVCIRVQSAKKDAEADAGEDVAATGGSLTISGGAFSSEIGNTIEMSGGNMTVTKGTFTKDATGADPDSTDNGSAIDIQGGKLSMTGSDEKTFTITGSHVNGIKSSGGGTVTAEHTTFSMSGGTDVVPENGNKYGTDMFGINIDSGTVTANGCDITIYGTYSAGILSMGKNVDGSTVSVGAADNTASEIKVYVPESQKLLSSAGISSEGGKIQLTGDVNIETNGLGITARGPIDITGGEATVITTHGTGIYVSGATITNTATLTVKSNITSGWSWVKRPENPDEDVNTNVNNGIYVENGSIDASAGTLNVTHTGVATAEDAAATTSFPTAVQIKSYAVYVTGEVSSKTAVQIGSGTINAAQAGGVYVENGAVSLGASSKNVTINTGGWNTAQDQIVSTQGTYASAVYANGGTVTMEGTITINSAAIGIVATAADTGTGTGAVTIKSGTTTITAYRSTGVYIRGGSLENSGTLTVDSKITNSTGGTASTAEDAYKWAGADIEGDTENENIYNGVYVKGGSLISNGTLNVNFTGVKNDDTTDPNAYLNQLTRSYAVRVEAGESANTTVTILSGEIINSVGGGVLANGGRVTLGKEGDTTGYSESNPTGLTVQTTGKEVGSNISGPNDAWGTWDYRANISGGDAVKVDNGTLYVNGGKFTADQGNGILVRSGNAYVYNGYFSGKDSAEGFNTGYGAAYAFKLYGGNLSIFGGEFRSEGGGAFIMGTAESEGTAKIYGGIIEAKGASAVSVWQYADVLFDNEVDSTQEAPIDDVPENYADTRDLYVAGASTGVAMEGNTNTGFSVKVSGSGMFTGGSYTKDGKVDVTGKGNSRNGIWYGNGNATLNISGGTLQGETTSGLWFEANPGNNVQLSGGEYRGNGSAWGGNNLGDIQTRNLLVTNNDNGSQTFGWLYDLSGNAIIYAYRLTALGDYDDDRSHVGGEARSVALNGNLSVTETWTSSDPLNNYHFIAVESGSRATDLPLEENRDFGADWASREYPST